MFFKNIQIFLLAEPFTFTAEELQEKMQSQAARPCSKLERMHYGWTSPLGAGSKLLVHAANGRYLISARKEEKLLPVTVVREHVANKILEIEREENRKVSAREKRALFDQMSVNLLPQAFSKSQHTYAYIDPQQGWLVVDTSNRNRAEDLTVLLRTTLGSLKLANVVTAQNPAALLTQWLIGEDLPRDMNLEDWCELQDPNAEATMIKCVNQDVTAKEVVAHVTSGKQVIRLALTWRDRLNFIVDSSLGIRRLRFLNLEQAATYEGQAENPAEKFDADFAIFSGEFTEFLPCLWEMMGGLQVKAS